MRKAAAITTLLACLHPWTASAKVDFAKDIAPILQARCLECQ